MGSSIRIAVGVLLCTAMTVNAAAPRADPSASLKKGTPDLKSAGPLTFGPDGILFVGDTQGAALFAIDTGDRAKGKDTGAIKVEGINAKVAELLGTNPQQILINDLAINPASGRAYLSVSRGRGPGATPVLIRVGTDGKLEEVSLDNVPFAKAEIPNVPAASAAPAKAQGRRGGGDPRNDSITDLAYVDGRVFLAGLSNEEFSSRLLAIPFPFSGETDGAGIKIYHGAHGRYETHAPVRTFVSYKIAGEPYLLASYQCTPLVKIPVSELKAGAHVNGTTIAELGNGNRPLDMVVYQKDGKDYLLLTNNTRGVMKIPTDGAETAAPITNKVAGTQGLGYETIASLKGVDQLDQLDKTRAVVLIRRDGGALNLETIDLP
jgi:hypothetical protein